MSLGHLYGTADLFFNAIETRGRPGPRRAVASTIPRNPRGNLCTSNGPVRPTTAPREQVEADTAAVISYAGLADSPRPEEMAGGCPRAPGAAPRELNSRLKLRGAPRRPGPVAGTCGMAGCSALLSDGQNLWLGPVAGSFGGS